MQLDTHAGAPATLDFDLCIVGAGPAGLTLAQALDGSNCTVGLLECGGFEPEAAAQDLADGETLGEIKPSVEVNRRQFGGNANVWRVKFAPGALGLRHTQFDPIDFAARPWVPHSGWPFCRDTLAPWYRQAVRLCQAGAFEHGEAALAQGDLRLAATALQWGLFRFGPAAVFHHQLRERLLRSRNVTVCVHAPVVEIEASDGGAQVLAVQVARPGAAPLRVRARAFVLAAGGFENARLLLASRGQQACGLGNQHDVVGRYYHDHLQARGGWLVPQRPEVFTQVGRCDMAALGGAPGMGFFRLSDDVQARERLLNVNALLFPRPGPRQTRAIESFNELRERLRAGPQAGEPVSLHPRLGAPQHLLRTALGADHVAAAVWRAVRGRQATAYGLGQGGWSLLSQPHRRFARFEVWHVIEQSPDPDNRVTLSDQRDAFGRPRVQVRWRWSADDVAMTLRAQHVFAREFAQAGIGTLQVETDPQGRPNICRPAGSHHLMGTTRMHADPRQGVVDAQCRVHGIGNLYIAGSSTFPAGGYATPTLTIVAMALRLAAHLQPQLTGGGPGRAPATVSLPQVPADSQDRPSAAWHAARSPM